MPITFACEFLGGPCDGDERAVAEECDRIFVKLGDYDVHVAGVTFIGAKPVRSQAAVYLRASLTSFQFADYVWGQPRLVDDAPPDWPAWRPPA